MRSSGYQRSSGVWDRLVWIQEELKRKVRIQPLQRKVLLVAGCDCGIRQDQGVGVVVVFKLPELEEVEYQYYQGRLTIPYRSGFLGFREVPLLIPAFQRLKHCPDLILVDGQGIAHPRNFGLACHLGVLINQPTIGCAKSRLIGRYQEPGLKRGSYSSLYNGTKRIGYVLRTKDRVRCLFVSPGHCTDLQDARRWTLRLAKPYRLPQVIRRAHHYARVLL